MVIFYFYYEINRFFVNNEVLFTWLWVIQFNIVFGTLCALLANQKGHNGTFWFLVGLFFGPIGLFATCIQQDKIGIGIRPVKSQSDFVRYVEKLEPKSSLHKFLDDLSRIGIASISDYDKRFVFECDVIERDEANILFSEFVWKEKMPDEDPLSRSGYFDLWSKELSDIFIVVTSRDYIYFFKK